MCGWETLSKGPDVKLAVVTVWRDGELVCVWPLYTSRQGWVRVACHLGSGDLHEYAGPLVRNDDDTAEIVQAALKVVKGLADVVRVYNVRSPDRVADALHADKTPKRESFIVSPVVAVGGLTEWEPRFNQLSRKLRAQLRHDRRQLERLGELQFREMAGTVDGPRCVEWIFEHKRAWLVRRGLSWSFILKPQIRRFFDALAVRPQEPDGSGYRVATFALTLDDTIVAACILLLSADRVEFHTTAFDVAFADHSPGVLMIEECVKLSIARGVDFDFRLVRQEYKDRWSDRLDRYDSFHLGCSPLGVAMIQLETIQTAIKVVRSKYGPRIKALLRGRRSGRA